MNKIPDGVVTLHVNLQIISGIQDNYSFNQDTRISQIPLFCLPFSKLLVTL